MGYSSRVLIKDDQAPDGLGFRASGFRGGATHHIRSGRRFWGLGLRGGSH